MKFRGALKVVALVMALGIMVSWILVGLGYLRAGEAPSPSTPTLPAPNYQAFVEVKVGEKYILKHNLDVDPAKMLVEVYWQGLFDPASGGTGFQEARSCPHTLWSWWPYSNKGEGTVYGVSFPAPFQGPGGVQYDRNSIEIHVWDFPPAGATLFMDLTRLCLLVKIWVHE